MSSLGYFAARSDHEAVIQFLLASTDVRIFESYSVVGRELREFRSFAELVDAFGIGLDPKGYGASAILQLWSPSVEATLRIERIELDPTCCDGETFRFRLDGAGLIQLCLGGLCGKVVTKSHYAHFSEAGARRWEKEGGIDWTALKRLSNRIQYHIRNRLAIARVAGRPVLPEACRYARSGYELKETAYATFAYQLSDADSTPTSGGGL